MTPQELAQLHHACFTTPRPWNAAEFADLLNSPHVWLVLEPGGFAMGRAIAGEAELLTIAVSPSTRRQGTGSRLLSQFEADAAARGAEECFLEVAADNVAALHLYGSAGYHVAGRRRAYYRTERGEEVDAIVMRKAVGMLRP